MSKKELIKRYILLIIGIFTMAFGIATMVQAKLGTSPISSMPYVVSLKFTSISLGMFTFSWNMILIFGQILILGKRFKMIELLQVPVSVVFGLCVDLCKHIIRNILPQNYTSCALLLIAGCCILALGVSFTVLANVIMNSGEAFVKAITIRTNKDFGDMKVVFDVSLVLISVLSSLLFFNKIVGVREGTIVAAIISGFIIKFFNKHLSPLVNFFLLDKDYNIDTEKC